MNDTPSVISKINIWTFINLRVFKFKFVRNMFFFVIGLNKFKLNSILYNYRDWNFEQFFFKFLKLILVVILVFFLFKFLCRFCFYIVITIVIIFF